MATYLSKMKIGPRAAPNWNKRNEWKGTARAERTLRKAGRRSKDTIRTVVKKLTGAKVRA